MRTRGNHNRTTGAQDHKTTPQQATQSKTDALEGFYRQLEALRGKYTLLTTKRKYEATSHLKQAYNNRLTIQARHQKPHARELFRIIKVSKFCHKVVIFRFLKSC